jgi:hypothetical protein
VKGIQAHVNGRGNNATLVLTIPLGQSQGFSKSGRSTIIASTQGNCSLSEITNLKKDKSIQFGLNVFDYSQKQVKTRTKSQVIRDEVKKAKEVLEKDRLYHENQARQIEESFDSESDTEQAPF